MDFSGKAYAIVSASTAEILEEKVSEGIIAGYRLQGGVSVVCNSPATSSVMFYQAMTLNIHPSE